MSRGTERGQVFDCMWATSFSDASPWRPGSRGDGSCVVLMFLLCVSGVRAGGRGGGAWTGGTTKPRHARLSVAVETTWNVTENDGANCDNM